MKNILKGFWKDEEGATIMEYILMIAVGAGIIALVFPFIKKLLGGFVNDSAKDMEKGINGNDGGMTLVEPTAGG